MNCNSDTTIRFFMHISTFSWLQKHNDILSKRSCGSNVRGFGLGLLMHSKGKQVTIKVHVVREFPYCVSQGSVRVLHDLKNSRIGQIVGAEQVAIIFMSLRMHKQSLQHEAIGKGTRCFQQYLSGITNIMSRSVEPLRLCIGY